MSDKYLFNQTGVVSELFLPGKAILTFNLHGQEQRVLLWVKGYVHQGRLLDKADSFTGKLNIGDTIHFNCHIYDKESSNNCQWYAARASKEPDCEANPQTNPKVVSQSGCISEVHQGKGVILFDFCDQEQRVFFLRSKYYHFGSRMTGRHSLTDYLSENDRLQFDAEMCEPNEDNFNCNWFATLVWKGKKPQIGSGTFLGYAGSSGAISDFGYNNDDGSVASEPNIVPSGYSEFPTIGLPPGLVVEQQGYKAFEMNNSVREGPGNVLRLFNEECGLALWMVRCNTWETVFFHRRNAFLDTVSLKNFDLQESYSEETALEISAVAAKPDFPCRWIARRVMARC